MRPQTINAICLLLAGLLLGWFLSSRTGSVVPTGELIPMERTVEVGKALDVDLLLRNRPSRARIAWRSDKGQFSPEVTESDLRSVFTAPQEQGRVRLWVDLIDGGRVLSDVASVYVDVARSPDAPRVEPRTSADQRTTAPAPSDRGAVRIELFEPIPPYDSVGGPMTSADIQGEVVGLVDPSQYRIVIYAKTQQTWWVQPLAAAPETLLNDRGQFSTWTHTGTRYAVLLVRTGFKPLAAVDGTVPLGDDVITYIEVEGRRKGT